MRKPPSDLIDPLIAQGSVHTNKRQMPAQQLVRTRWLCTFVQRDLLPRDDAQATAQWAHGGVFSVDGLYVRLWAASGHSRRVKWGWSSPVSVTRGLGLLLRRSRSFRRLSRLITQRARFYLGLDLSNHTVQEFELTPERGMGNLEHYPFLHGDRLCQIKGHLARLVQTFRRRAMPARFLARELQLARLQKTGHRTSIARRARPARRCTGR